jgi:hypothetical protein
MPGLGQGFRGSQLKNPDLKKIESIKNLDPENLALDCPLERTFSDSRR